ncbi:PREDICTED: uncharacterized protein LOC105364427 [Ceratosolen solmsi marchali]|uniref:Uncharacterized protein LOC105364427 n=1 Tax=Ceratosolen solmsi marchali TaxID=326594 RepID=A0AAJ6YM75_9HYME|nr:PREDICTED: uncharacterized protein LOC105364427 [Ceratosolen solmsi marchali]
MNADMRRQRQLEYEKKLNTWADIGKKKQKSLKEKLKKFTGFPFWYTEFSLLQLQYLKELKDTMFQDKEEQTTFRTLNTLSNIGIITDTLKVESRIVRKYLNKYNTDPIRFLCEIYKAVSGDYFENEEFKRYNCTERIILSGIAFLELPKIILELQKRLPPVHEGTYLAKPKPPRVRRPIKKISPYLEKLLMPPHWKAYAVKLEKWRIKCSTSIRPVVILPKIVNTHDKRATAEGERKGTSITPQKNKDDKHIERINSIEQTSSGLEDKNKKQDINNSSDVNFQEFSSVDAKYKQDIHSFSMQDWTNPPSPCPYKYRKLMEKVGPVKTDKDFFNELGYENKKKYYPSGRKNLSVKMQSYLLGLESNLYKVTDDVDKLTCKVGAIAKEIFESDQKCSPCCVCEQTQKTEIKLHNTKSPHLMIDSILTVKDDKTQVIGATAMHSPASSISSIGEPLRIPSSEKLVKNVIITGTATTVDGETVKQVEGISKAIEHVPHHTLRPEINTIEIRNVPPCACSKDAQENEIDEEIIVKDKYADMCYGRKYRPDEGPAYSCKEFKKNEPVEEDYEYKEYNSDKYMMNNDATCGCGIEFEKCSLDDEAEYPNSIKSEFENIQEYSCEAKGPYRICKRCGRKVDAKCSIIPIRKTNLTKYNKNLRKEIADECSCHSLSEYLKFNIDKMTCLKPKKETFNKQMITEKNESKKLSIKSTNIHSQTENQTTDSAEIKIVPNNSQVSTRSTASLLDAEKHEEYCQLEKKMMEKNASKGDNFDKNTEEEIMKSSSLKYISTNGGPYGWKTKSEEELPTEYTLSHLVPPKYPLCSIPTADGKSTCKCRENRNNRKILLYNIGGMVNESQNNRQDPPQKDSLPRVIEGVTWLSPEPSIRRSEEYVPEYELYDSPYDKMCKVSTKMLTCSDNKEANNNATTSRSQDWENSFNDPYLSEFYTQKKAKVSCSKKCSKFPKQNEKIRQLRVMKPVCECKYERKIMKKNEEQRNRLYRQNRVKSLNRISDTSMPASPSQNLMATQSSNSNNTVMKYSGIEDTGKTIKAQVEISSITMQTPVVTPVQSKYSHNNSFDISYQSDTSDKMTENLPIKVDESHNVLLSKNEFSKDRKKLFSGDTNQLMGIQDEHKDYGGIENNMTNPDTNIINTLNGNSSQLKSTTKMKRSPSFYDRLEEELKIQMRHELEKMATEDFISVKLPGFYKMPQLLYWISYRTKGMYLIGSQKESMEEAIDKNKWSIINERISRKNIPPIIMVKKEDKKTLNFNKAMYWKKKIAEYKLKFYTQLRQDILNFSRDVWPLMEFGKFPDIIFKQAYFTYLPSREKDAQVVRLWMG